MKPSAPAYLLLLALSASAVGTLSAASAERPRMEDYSSSFEFLQALKAWNRAHPDGTATAQPAPAPKADKPAPAIVLDPTSELAPPPFEVTGPEKLDEAVEKAKSIEHPDYKEKVRYHRSTHLSFPLHSIDGADMSQASIANVLGQGVADDHLKDSLDKQVNKTDQDRLETRGPLPAASAGEPAPTAFIGSGPRGTVNINVTGR